MDRASSEVERPWLRHYDAAVPAGPPGLSPHPPLPAAGRQHGAPAGAALHQFLWQTVKLTRPSRSSRARLAASLQRLGVQPGDRVALLLPNSPQFVIAYYAILKAGRRGGDAAQPAVHRPRS